MTGLNAAALVVERTVALSEIPAPPLDESDRAAVVAAWWQADGLDPVVDTVGNVRARLRDGDGAAIVVCAHLDTVFGRDVPHGVQQRGGRLHGPGVGDDTVAVTALSVLDVLLPARMGHAVWITATVGEEGLGDLKGMRHLVAEPPAELAAVIALEGNYLGRVVATGVGSVRWDVTLSGPGGHAWEAADRPSAVHEMARVVGALDEALTEARQRSRSSLNVGLVSGGEAVNARARTATMQVDIRSVDPLVLSDLEDRVVAVFAEVPDPAVRADMAEIGRRPAGSTSASHPLVASAVASLISAGLPAVMGASSTDANAAFAAGVPAVALGITTGGDEHTPAEWIDIEPIPAGLQALAATIVAYDEEAQ